MDPYLTRNRVLLKGTGSQQVFEQRLIAPVNKVKKTVMDRRFGGRKEPGIKPGIGKGQSAFLVDDSQVEGLLNVK